MERRPLCPSPFVFHVKSLLGHNTVFEASSRDKNRFNILCYIISQVSPVVSAEKNNSINGGTHHVTSEDTPKKKKGIFSKGKQMFKKIAKSHQSQNAKR